MIKIFKKEGFKQFVIRTGIFFSILLALQLSIFLYFSHTQFFQNYLGIPQDFYFDVLTGLNKQNLLNSAIFVVVAFLLWKRKEILDFNLYKQNYNETSVFGGLAFLTFFAHYIFKYWINTNLDYALDFATLLAFIKIFLNILFVVLLAFAAYNRKFVFGFVKRFYKDLGFFSIILILYYNLIWWFQNSWFYFSVIVGKTIYFIFSKIFDDVFFRAATDSGPILGVDGFFVAISKVCSGIDSLLFFTSLFIILVVTNWNELDKKRMALLFIPGLIGTFMLNIIRIFLLILIAVKISPEFAVDVFHTNAGWILFLGYFIVFWHFGSKWVIKK